MKSSYWGKGMNSGGYAVLGSGHILLSVVVFCHFYLHLSLFIIFV